MDTENTQKTYKIVILMLLTIILTVIVTTIIVYNQTKENIKYVPVDSSEIGKTFNSLKKWIEQKYIGEIDEEKMLETAIKGYVAGLGDKYCEYITKSEMEEYLEDAVGKFVGIGVYITNNTKTNQIQVLAPMEGGPADEAGILPGDVIQKINGEEYTAEQLQEASEKLKNEEGTKLELEILRGSEVIQLELECKEVKTSHVRSEILENNIGYIRLPSFDEDTATEFKNQYNELQTKNIKGLILDLRNNGGGVVDEALEIADIMVEKGKTLLITTSKSDGEKIQESENEKIINIPVVLLVNENTASASEILTADLKENENAKIVGKNTYGKGIIQTIYTLSDGSGLKLTTNEYFTPNRNVINKVGIAPDYEVELPEGVSIYSITRENDTQLQKAIQLFE